MTPLSLLLRLADVTLPVSFDTPTEMTLVTKLLATGLIVTESVPERQGKIQRVTVVEITSEGLSEIEEAKRAAPPHWAHH